MAEKAKAPLIPVRISGTYKVMEANHMWIKPANVTLTVLPPIPTAGLSREELKELGSAIREKNRISRLKASFFTQKIAHGTSLFHGRFSVHGLAQKILATMDCIHSPNALAIGSEIPLSRPKTTSIIAIIPTLPFPFKFIMLWSKNLA